MEKYYYNNFRNNDCSNNENDGIYFDNVGPYQGGTPLVWNTVVENICNGNKGNGIESVGSRYMILVLT